MNIFFDNNLNTTNDLGQKKSILLVVVNFLHLYRFSFELLYFKDLKHESMF